MLALARQPIDHDRAVRRHLIGVAYKFLDPLDSGSESMGHSERVESLVRQYARLLEQRWSQDPGNVL